MRKNIKLICTSAMCCRRNSHKGNCYGISNCMANGNIVKYLTKILSGFKLNAALNIL